MRSLYLVWVICLCTFVSVPAGAGLQTYHDARGKVIKLRQKPRRIVSASVAGDEILWLILKKAESLERLVGVSYLADQEKFSHISSEVKAVPFKVGKSLETFVKAQPDLLVLASFNRPELIQQIEQLSLPVFVMKDFKSIGDIITAIRSLATLIGEEKAGHLVEQDFVSELNLLKKSIKGEGQPSKVLAMVGEQGVMAKETLFDDMLGFTGGVNASLGLGLTGWPRLGDEALISLNPDFLVFPEEGGSTSELLAKLSRKASTKSWNAVKKCQLIRIPSRNLIAASPFILEGIRKIKTDIANKDLGSACGK
ncbi:MAG: ABC transporter substrate-binding protein [Oligoflexales bacterium]|nr:ABC transporter substrate-binding protein [Oligoflexales bacterium]